MRAPEGRRWTFLEIVQGKPLGHPTHALLVHYPLGFALAVAILDLIARVGDAAGAAAYLAVAAAISGLAAAVPGFVDWWGMIPGSRKRRVGTIHFVLQSAGIALLVASALLRWPERSAPASDLATGVAASAFVTLLVGNYFGGELVYRMGMRVHTAERGEAARVRDGP